MLEKVKDFLVKNEEEIYKFSIAISCLIIATQFGYIAGANDYKNVLPKNIAIETLSDSRMLINGRLFEKIIK